MTAKQKLEQKLWDIANELRGKMGADEFRDYMLGFIFYKYLSEKMLRYANKALEQDGVKYKDILTHPSYKEFIAELKKLSVKNLGFFLEPDELFSELVRRGNSDGKASFILGDLTKVLSGIEQSTLGTESEEDFENLFEDLDLTSSKLGKTEEDKNELIVKIMAHLNSIDFELDNTENDILGDAYEYLIGKFASGAGKKAGEFYTPQEVSSVLAKLVTHGKTRLKSVYDPTCGSGSLLLRVAKEVEEVGEFYGQESNPTTYNLCRMNMIMHNVHYRNFNIKNEDTLERPQHVDQRFDAVVANPPFSAKWSADPLKMNDERFSPYGRLAPKSKADFAFVQHMIHQLNTDGTMACVLPHGVLYRGAAEGFIREYLIKERNYLDAVISLPKNIFFGTGIPTCIIVLKKKRKHPDSILFIDASEDYEKAKKQNVLRPQDVSRIYNTYQKRLEIHKYSRNVKLSEIEENNYNLNFPRYITKFKAFKNIDINYVCAFLEKINKESIKTEQKLDLICQEIGIPKPVGSNIELLNLYKEGVIQKIFRQEISFKDKSGNTYRAWDKCTLGDIFSFRPTNSFSRDMLNYSNGDVMNIHYGDIHTKYHLLFDIKKEQIPFINKDVDISRIPEENYCKTGDLIIADASEDYADIGKSIELVNLNGRKVLAGLHTILARPEKHEVQIGFAGYLMKSPNVRLQIMKFAQGTKVLGISYKRISEVEVSIPSKEEQKKIVELLVTVDDKINLSNSNAEAIEEYKRQLTEI